MANPFNYMDSLAQNPLFSPAQAQAASILASHQLNPAQLASLSHHFNSFPARLPPYTLNQGPSHPLGGLIPQGLPSVREGGWYGDDVMMNNGQRLVEISDQDGNRRSVSQTVSEHLNSSGSSVGSTRHNQMPMQDDQRSSGNSSAIPPNMVGLWPPGFNLIGNSMLNCDRSQSGQPLPLVNMSNLSQFNFLGSLDPPPNYPGALPSIINVAPTTVAAPSGLQGQSREVIHGNGFTLYPPNPNAPPPTTRERPNGCRTVFVGGLPELIREETIREIFERCGEITTIRMSKKNFCHIRYDGEDIVQKAIAFSGYRIRLGNNSDSANTGRVHVDYAQARDDLHEWECRQRMLMREQRHKERTAVEHIKPPPSPPPIRHYSDHESGVLAEQLKGEDSFSNATKVLIGWLEKGECNKRNNGQFYSMIQSANAHVRRLTNEKSGYLDELNRARQQLMHRMQSTLVQFGQIEKVFKASCHQKVWDHFTKAQRKNIEGWKKQVQDIKKVHLDEVLNERVEDEMELSDDESTHGGSNATSDSNSEIKFIKFGGPAFDSNLSRQVNSLKEENDNLRCQVEAYKNESDLMKHEMKQEIEDKNKQIKAMEFALQGMQKRLIELTQRKRKKADGDGDLTDEIIEELSEPDEDGSLLTPSSNALVNPDARLISLISIFLYVHPFGASLDRIWSYLQEVDPILEFSVVQKVLHSFGNIFRETVSGDSASIDRRWMFIGSRG